jgi:hypothetical protein
MLRTLKGIHTWSPFYDGDLHVDLKMLKGAHPNLRDALDTHARNPHSFVQKETRSHRAVRYTLRAGMLADLLLQ